MRATHLGTVLLALGVCGLASNTACGGGRDGERHVDGGVFESGPDGQVPPPSLDAAAMVPTDGSPDPAELVDAGSAGERADLGPSVCYDGVDNDGNGAMDCDDDGCRTAASVCCVGSTDLACCSETASSTAFTIPGSCPDDSVSACAALDGFTFFGATSPWIEGGALVPGGGGGHGGVVLDQPLDPRLGHAEVAGVVEAPEMHCESCVDGAGVALVEAVPGPGSLAAIRLGLLVVGAREEVAVIVADEVVERVALADVVTLERTVTLRINASPDGTATFEVGAAESPWSRQLELGAWPDRLIPVAFGRTENLGPSDEPRRVRSASASRRACETPSALVRAEAPVLPGSGSTWTPGRLGRPTAIELPDATVRVIYEHEGSLYVAGQTMDGRFAGTQGEPGEPVLSPPAGAERLLDPWLVLEPVEPDAAPSAVHLFFVAVDAEGRTTLHRAVSSAAAPLRFSDTSAVLSPEDLAGVGAIDGPTVWTERGAARPWRMIVRAHLDSGGVALVSLARAEGEAWSYAGGDLASSIVREPSRDDLFAHDRDEVATPAVVRVTDVRGDPIWRLYYSARRGTRWSVAVMVSSDGSRWRDLGPVLAGDGVGFDAVSVADPAPLLRAGGSPGDEVLHLIYRGSDGSASAMGLAGLLGTIGG